MSWVRRLGIALGALVLLAGIVLVALVLFINPNDYKSTLVDLVRDRYDRTLVIDGDIRLSVMPRLGLEIGGVSISEPHSNQVFAAVDSARAAVGFWPLFSRHLVIEHLTLTGVKANVVRDGQGRFNFDDLLRAPASGEAVSAPAPADPADGSIQLAVGGVTVSGGDIALRDESNDMAVRLERLNVSATGIATGQAFDVNATTRLLGQSPRADATVQLQGRLGIDPTVGRLTVTGLDLRMTGVLPSVKANAFGARGDVVYDADSGALALSGVSIGFQGDLALASPLTNVDAQLTAPQLLVDLQGGRVQLEGLAGKAQGRLGAAPFTASVEAPRLSVDEAAASGGPLQLTFALEGEAGMSARLGLTGISGSAERLAVAQAEVKASLRRQGRTAAIDLVSPASASLTARTLTLDSLDATARIEGAGMPQAGLVFPVTGRLAVDALAGAAEGRLQAGLPGGDAVLTAAVTDLRTVPALTFELTAKTLDVDALWPAAPATATPAAPAAAPARAADAPAPAETPLDLSALQMLNAQGQVRVAALTWGGLDARDVSARLALRDGHAVLRDVNAQVFEGRLSGQAAVDATTQQVSTQGQWSGVAVKPMLTQLADYDGLSGRGTVRWSLSTAGKSLEALRRGLSGELALDVRNGAVRGFNVAHALREFRTLIGRGEAATQAASAEQSTDFSELRAALALAQGVGTLTDLYVAAPLLRITEGSPATVDLVNERLDLMVEARVVNTSTGQDGKALDALRGVTVPIHLTGPWQSVAYSVQWNQVAARTLTQTLEREAGRQLERLLGGREREPAPEAGGNGADEAARGAGKMLGNALKGLFTP